jgi:glycosyltransferase involved in cell wall biosynthesis
MAKVSVVVPVYNEAGTILGILDKLGNMNLGNDELEVIVVDGASTDGTQELLRNLAKPWLRIVYEDARRGKGVAVAEGYRLSTGDAVIIQDADFEYDPDDIPAIVLPIIAGKSQVVYGSRFEGRIENMSASRRLANRLLTTFVNLLYGSRLTDVCTCYKALEGQFARSLELETRSFDVCLEISAKSLRSGRRVLEVPISYRARGQNEGVKSDWTALPRALATMVKFRFAPIRTHRPSEQLAPRE